MGCNHSKIACGCGNHIVDRDGKEYCLPSCQTEVSIEKAERELLRFKARQLLAAKKGHLKARGYKRGSKPADNARVHQAPLNPIKKFLGIDTVEVIFDRLITTVVNGKQVRPYHEDNQASTEHGMCASNDTVPEQIKTSGSILELRDQEKQDARYKEVAKKFVNGVLCRALDVMARAEESSSSPLEHSQQLKEDTPIAPNEKGVKIPDAVKIFVDDIIANAADVVRAEILLSAGSPQDLVDIVPDTIAKDVPKGDVENVDEQEIQVPEILEKDPENLDVLKDEQLALVWVNWGEVKVNVDAEVKEGLVDVKKDYEDQVSLTVACAEEDRNVDLQTEESGYVAVSWDQVKVSVDGQVNVGPEVSEDQVLSTQASPEQDSNVDLQIEESGYVTVSWDQVKVSADGQVKVGTKVSEDQESFTKASAELVKEDQALVQKDSIPLVLVEWTDVKLSIDGEIKRGPQTRKVIADKVQVNEVAQEQINVEEEEDIPLVLVKWEAVKVSTDGVIRDGAEAKRIKQSEDQMLTTQDIVPKRDVTNVNTGGSEANERKKQEEQVLDVHGRQEMSIKCEESVATLTDNLAVAMGDSYALADSEDAVPMVTALLPNEVTNTEEATMATDGLVNTNPAAKGNCIEDESPNTEDGETVHAKVHNMHEEKVIPDEKDGTNIDQKASTVQKKELSLLTAVMTKDEVLEVSMSYYTRLLEGMASNEERDTQTHAQVRHPTECKEENSIVRPDDRRLLAYTPIGGETRHQNDDDAHGTKTSEGGKTISKTADLGHDVMEEYIGNDDANSKRETIVGPDDGILTKNAEEMRDTKGSIEDSRGNGTQTIEGEKPIARPGDGGISKSDHHLPTLNDFNGMKQASDQRKKDITCERQKSLSIGSISLRPMGNWRQRFLDEKTKKSSSKENISGKKGNTSGILGVLWNESINPLGSWTPKPLTLVDYVKPGTRPKKKMKKKTPPLDSVDGGKITNVARREVYSIPKEPANINPPPFIIPLDTRKVSGKPLAAKMKTSLVYRTNNQKHKRDYHGVPSLPDPKSTENYEQRPLESLSASLSRLGSRFTSSNHRYKYTKVNTVGDSETGNEDDSTHDKETSKGGKPIARPGVGKISKTADLGHDLMDVTREEYIGNDDANSKRETIVGPDDGRRTKIADGTQTGKREKPIARPGDGGISKSDDQLPTLNDFNGMKQASDGNIDQSGKKDITCERQKSLPIGSISLRPMGNWRQRFLDEKTKKSSSKENSSGKKGNTSGILGVLWNDSINPLGSWAPKPLTLVDYVKPPATRPKKKMKKKTPPLDSVDGGKITNVARREVYSIPKEPANINPPPFIIPLDTRKVSGKPLATKMKTSLVYRTNNQKHKRDYHGVPSLPDPKSTENYEQRPLESLSASLSRLGSRFTSNDHRYKYTKVNTVEDGERGDTAPVMGNPAPMTLRCRDEILYEKDNNKEKKEYECDAEDIALAIEEFNHTRQVLSFDGLVSTALVYKFLLARDFVVGDATSLYKNYLSLRRTYYRAELNPLDDPLQSELFSGRFTVLDSRDQYGAAIAVFTAHLHGVDINHEVVMNNIYLQLDETMKSNETQRQGMILIYDFSNITYKTCDVHLCSKILELFLSAYPLRLKKTFVVSPPFWFESEMRLISAAFRDTKYRKDIHIVTQSRLKDILPVTCVPVGLGGDCETNPMRLVERCITSHKDRTGMTESKVERSSDAGEMMSCDSQRNVLKGEEQEKDEKDSECPTVFGGPNETKE